MATGHTSEQGFDQIEKQTYAFLHYKADIPATCDLAFRKFVTNSIFNGAILIPVRSGPGRKLTTEGVVKVLADSLLQKTTIYKDSKLTWTPITEFLFERYKKELSTKIYFRGFPMDMTLSQVASFFGPFGPLQYVYIMCDPVGKQRSNKQGYIIFESRAAVERLFCHRSNLSFKGFSIYVEEYKTKNSSILNGRFQTGHSTETLFNKMSSNAIRSKQDDQEAKNAHILALTPDVRSPYNPFPLTRDFTNSSPKLVSSSPVIQNKSTLESLTNIDSKKRCRLRTFLLFGKKIEENSTSENLRFNRQPQY